MPLTNEQGQKSIFQSNGTLTSEAMDMEFAFYDTALSQATECFKAKLTEVICISSMPAEQVRLAANTVVQGFSVERDTLFDTNGEIGKTVTHFTFENLLISLSKSSNEHFALLLSYAYKTLTLYKDSYGFSGMEEDANILPALELIYSDDVLYNFLNKQEEYAISEGKVLDPMVKEVIRDLFVRKHLQA